MRSLLVVITLLLYPFATGCSWLQKAPPAVQAILTPLQSAGCGVETAITGAMGAAVVSDCAGTDAVACGQGFEVALGNVNLCSTPLPSGFATTWKTVGDVPADALKVKNIAGKMGVVGNVACPIAIDAALGLLTGQVPKACGCTKNLSAGQMGTTMISVCEMAVPI